ncbi:hypothetical protein FQN50_005458 [Emmonsiellopsis sp. PD_5]|nr:hypothetical protein FQN50_005458 [Emmonsiellopsis sp. PD_5]
MHDFSLRSLPWGSQSPTTLVSPVGTFNTEIPNSGMLLQWLIDVNPKMSSKKQTLFCPGVPGSGKSIITSIAIQELTENLGHDGDIGIAYAYCDFQQRYNDTDLLAILIKQLIQGQRSLPDNVQSLHRTHQTTQTRPSFDEMSTALQSIAALYLRVFIFIDALDEYQVSANSREKFLGAMFDLRDKHGANLFVTSRFVPDITEVFSASTWLPIGANNQDVEAYVEGRMQGVPSHPCSSEPLLDELKTVILDAARAMFRLVPMYINSLHGKHSAEVVRDALKGFEENTFAELDFLEPVYGPIVARVLSHPDAIIRHLAKQVFLWISCAPSPLTEPQLQHALAVKIGESKLAQNNLRIIRDIVSACAGLVVVDNKTSIVKFVHYTVHEYFRQTREKWFPNAESDLSKICITYLSYSDFESGCCRTHAEPTQRLQSYPLYSCASKNRGLLVHKATASNEPNNPNELDTINQMTVTLLENTMKAKASGQVLLEAQDTPQTFSENENLTFAPYGLHFAAFFGLEEPTRTLVGKENVDLEDSFGRTPLWYALRAPHAAVVKLLLDHGANIGRVPRVNGLTPLLWAVSEGHEDIVQLLLDSGVDIEECSPEDEQTPLLLASINKQERLVELLIDKGAKVDASDRFGRTPLFYAATNGHGAIANVLLDAGANIETRDKVCGWTPLLCAIRNVDDDDDVFTLLICRGADMYVADFHGRTLIWWAIDRGKIGLAVRLATKGANVNVFNDKCVAPLIQALRIGDEILAINLIAYGAYIEVVDNDSWTPLMLASRKGYISVVKLLFEKRADVNIVNSVGETAVFAAIKEGNVNIVRLLLQHGADVTTTDRDGKTLFSIAAENGYAEVTDLLRRRSRPSARMPIRTKSIME